MIRLFDYVIDADNNCYIVGKERVRKNKDGEEEKYIFMPKYYGSLAQACGAIYKQRVKELVSNEDMTLAQAIKKIEELENEFEEFVRKQTKDF